MCATLTCLYFRGGQRPFGGEGYDADVLEAAVWCVGHRRSGGCAFAAQRVHIAASEAISTTRPGSHRIAEGHHDAVHSVSSSATTIWHAVGRGVRGVIIRCARISRASAVRIGVVVQNGRAIARAAHLIQCILFLALHAFTV